MTTRGTPGPATDAKTRRVVAGRRRRRDASPAVVFAVVPGAAAAWILRRVTPAAMRNEAGWLRGTGRPRRAAQLEMALEQLELAAAESAGGRRGR